LSNVSASKSSASAQSRFSIAADSNSYQHHPPRSMHTGGYYPDVQDSRPQLSHHGILAVCAVS
jgi:hypothetical protein